MTKEIAKELIEKLVESFDARKSELKHASYNETKTRNELINPFFEALGWDMNNKQELGECYRDIFHEDKVKVGGKTKAPDYGFTDYGKRKFFLEAKKPSVDIKEQIQPAYQLRRYGWSAKMPISLITDFEELAIYDCTIKPIESDKASVARIKYITYKDYVDEIDFLWDTFSKEEVIKGSLNRFVDLNKSKKGTEGVDEEFLESLDRWRDLLARNIVNRNISIWEDELNYSVQKIIDRLIFLRICEDRGVEMYGQIQNTLGNGIYEKLKYIFHSADQKYNSGLFDYKKDIVTDNLNIDDKILKTIIEEMYFPKSPFEFSVIPVEILGHSYEQYLGKFIRITPSHILKIEKKPELRKSQGVYYTPQFIVEYIVNNTLGMLIEGKTLDEVSKIKICDPACGSGSFLISAYQFLLDWHSVYYNSELVKNKSKYLTPHGNLTTAIKKQILLNNIFGVDIDANAVEVTKLSLMLKAMEGETEASINNQLKLLQERVLPTLDNNIKCGNSLIGNDYFDKLEFDKSVLKKINPFDWKEDDKFDVVIGNPPYVDSETMTSYFPGEREYISKNYKTTKGNWDLYIPFIEKSLKILKTNGRFSFITPNKWLSMNYGSALRHYIKDYLVNFSDYSNINVFRDAGITSIVFILEKNISDSINIKVFNDDLSYYETEIKKSDYSDIDNFGLYFSKNIIFLNKLLKFENKLGNFCKISGAFSTSEAYELIPYVSELTDDTDQYLKFINTGTIERFHTVWGFAKTTYLKSKYLQPIVKVKDFKKKFPKRYERFNKEKIIISGIRHFESIYDENIEYIAGKSTTVLIDLNEKYRYSTISAILNSRIISYFLKECYSSAGMGGGINFSPDIISTIPLPNSEAISDEVNKILYETIIILKKIYKEFYNSKLNRDQELFKNQIVMLENKINQLVYKLYDLTDEEIKIVEGA